MVIYLTALSIVFTSPTLKLFFAGCSKLERCISEWSSWLKSTAERRGEDDQWEPDERPTGLTRMVGRLLFQLDRLLHNEVSTQN